MCAMTFLCRSLLPIVELFFLFYGWWITLGSLYSYIAEILLLKLIKASRNASQSSIKRSRSSWVGRAVGRSPRQGRPERDKRSLCSKQLPNVIEHYNSSLAMESLQLKNIQNIENSLSLLKAKIDKMSKLESQN